VHAFPSAGIYLLNLSVTDSAGSRFTTSFNATVVDAPQPMTATIAASNSIGLAPLNVSFRATVYLGGGAPYQLSWDFGDGTTPVNGTLDWNVSHPYPLTGSFPVLFQATDRWGRSANATTVISIVPPLHLDVSASPSLGPVPLVVALRATVSGGDAPGPVYWQFGDGSLGTTGPTAEHTYAAPGDYPISAEVRDALGEDRWQNVSVSALAGSGGPAPLAAFGSVTVVGADCTTNTTVVNVLSDASGGAAPYSFAWDFGDASPIVSGSSASHPYALVGAYVVTLNVTDNTGSSALNESFVTIDPWSCPGATTHPQVPSPSTVGWATPTNLAILALGIGIVAVAAILAFRRYRR
jgi:PKD repeat protein